MKEMKANDKKRGNPIWAILIALIFVTFGGGYYLTNYIRWWQSCLIVNALYGLLFFELAWRDTYRFRQVDEARDSLFPAFRRLDVKTWSRQKWRFYPGAMTLMPARALISLGSFALCCLILHFVMIGHDSKKPTTGLREKLRKTLFWFWNSIIPMAAFMSVKYQTIHYDYSYYLGEGYEQTQKLPKKASTVVSNHQSWMDNMILVSSPLSVAFAAKTETQKVWILSSMIKYTQGIFITRGGTKEEREKQI